AAEEAVEEDGWTAEEAAGPVSVTAAAEEVVVVVVICRLDVPTFGHRPNVATMIVTHIDVLPTRGKCSLLCFSWVTTGLVRSYSLTHSLTRVQFHQSIN